MKKNFKYKVGDLVRFCRFIYPITNAYALSDSVLGPNFKDRFPHFVPSELLKTYGLILKRVHHTKLFAQNPPQGYDKSTQDFNSYDWYSVNHSLVYHVHEFEIEKVKA